MKAIIHIGTGKTGTSTIQSFLAKNRESLKKQGIFVPTSAWWSTGNHLELAAATFIPDLQNSSIPWFAPMLKKGFTTTDQDEQWEKYRREIETNCNNDGLVIFSCEAFSEFTEQEVERVKELMDSLFDETTIVAYVRRQPEWLVSSYSTLVLLVDFTDDIFDAMNSSWEHRITLNYCKVVERWSIFEKNKLKIRIFDKQEFHDNDLLSDFAYTVGFDVTGLERVKNGNVSLTSAEAEFLRLLNVYIPGMIDPWTPNFDRTQIYNYFWHRKEKGREGEKDNKAYYLNRKEAQQILEQYREGNDWIAREFLGREKLFSEDVSMYPEEVASPHGLTIEKSVEISALIYKELLAEKLCQSEEYQTEICRQNAAFHAELSRLQGELSCQSDEICRLQAHLQKVLLPRWLGKFISCFIPKKKNRQRFRAKYVKDKK